MSLWVKGTDVPGGAIDTRSCLLGYLLLVETLQYWSSKTALRAVGALDRISASVKGTAVPGAKDARSECSLDTVRGASSSSSMSDTGGLEGEVAGANK